MTLWIDRLHPAPTFSFTALRLVLASLGAVLVLFLPGALQGPAAEWSARIDSPQLDDSERGWRDVELTTLTLPRDRISTLRATVRLDEATIASGAPLGLFLSGTFSAEAMWNGAPVGAKGRPGAAQTKETAGPIDTVIALPPDRLRVGDNELVLRLSAAHLGHPVRTVVHGEGPIFGLRVALFSSEARRPIAYYAAPFFMSGILWLGFLALVLRGELRTPGAVMLAGLALAAAAEVSRSVINYPYSLHDVRRGAVSLAVTVFCGAMLMQACRTSGLSWPLPRLAGGFLLCLAVAASFFTGLTTEKVVLICATTAAVIAGWGALRGRRGSLELAVAFALIAAFAAVEDPAFMARGFYAAAVPLTAFLIWQTRERLASAPELVAGPDRLTIGPPEARRFVPLSAIRTIRGAGDYAELHLKTGERVLQLETLQTLAQRLPQQFFRAHRSHIINLHEVEALCTGSGGRHRVRLSDGSWAPVSRARVAELRGRLGG